VEEGTDEHPNSQDLRQRVLYNGSARMRARCAKSLVGSSSASLRDTALCAPHPRTPARVEPKAHGRRHPARPHAGGPVAAPAS